MIKVTDIKLNPQDMTADVALFSDTKSEVVSEAEIVGLPEGYSVAMGSSIMTSAGELAFMKSNGQWHWV